MNQNILLSKIVANATEESWAQVYSTLNLYIVVSIEKEGEQEQEKNIASHGRELLERLQREFFALDEKNLSSIKEVVQKVVDNTDTGFSYSLILVTIVNSVAYIIIGHSGFVLLKRGGSMGIVAEGEVGKVVSFSGTLKENDLIILATREFLERVPLSKLTDIVENTSFLEIAENVAPLIHDHAKGAEASVLIQYKTDSGERVVENPQDHEVLEPKITHTLTPAERSEEESPPAYTQAPVTAPPTRRLGVPSLNFKGKKIAAVGLILIILIGIFAFVLFSEYSRRQKARDASQATETLTPLQKKYDEAVALLSVNRALGIESLTDLNSSLKNAESKFKEDSDGKKQLRALEAKVESTLKEQESGATAKNQMILLENSTIKSVGPITQKGGTLAVADRDSGTVALVVDGKITSSQKNVAASPLFITGDKANIYILGDRGVYRMEKAGKTVKKIISLDDTSRYAGIDTFLGNIYLLRTTDKSIEKYASGAFEKSAYLSSGTTIADTPSSFAIDSSIYVAEANGTIEKFTKGKKDSFSLSGMVKKLGRHVLLYTDPDASNLYALDPDNERVVAIKKNGEYDTSFESKDLKNATSFAVDEKGKKIYFVAGNKLYSFDM